MTAQQIAERLQGARSEWEPYGVGALFLFGSAARGEAREDSDIDPIVDFTRPVGLFDFIGLQQRLTTLSGTARRSRHAGCTEAANPGPCAAGGDPAA
jgi:predicted nucleotidyltransferase